MKASLWLEKAQLAHEAAQREVEAGNLPASANRAYYALYSHITGMLLQQGHQPPASRENWPHTKMPWLLRTHFGSSFHKRLTMTLLDRLYRYRVQADYGDHTVLDPPTLEGSVRQLGSVLGSDWRM